MQLIYKYLTESLIFLVTPKKIQTAQYFNPKVSQNSYPSSMNIDILYIQTKPPNVVSI